MGGVDIIVFTGGIGENDCDTRAKVIEGLEFWVWILILNLIRAYEERGRTYIAII